MQNFLQQTIIDRRMIDRRMIDRRMIDQQHYLTVDFVADLAAVEAAHGGPGLAAQAHVDELGVQAAGGVASACLEI